MFSELIQSNTLSTLEQETQKNYVRDSKISLIFKMLNTVKNTVLLFVLLFPFDFWKIDT